MIGITIVRGISVEVLVNENGVPSLKADDLMEYHRGRPRIGSEDWGDAEEQEHPPFWLFKNEDKLPRRVHEALLAFDQSRRDVLLVVDAATCKSDVPGKPEPASVVSGEVIIRHGMRIVASPWGMAWWDEVRTTTSYVAPFEMIRRMKLGRFGS